MTNKTHSKTKPITKKRIRKQQKAHPLVITLLSILLIVGTTFLILYPFGITLKLNGNDKITVEYACEYVDEKAKAFFYDEDCSDEIVTEGSVDTSVLGDYTIKYTYKRGIRLAKSVTRVVSVADTTPPELKLSGAEKIMLLPNGEYTEAGYSATDNYDGELTQAVSVSGNIDTAVPGVYNLTYTVTDSGGNSVNAVRIVEVTDKNPLEADIADFSLEGFFPNATLTQTEDGGLEYLHKLIFIGDSITGNFAFISSLPTACVWTRSMLTPDNIWTQKVNVYKDNGSYGNVLDNLAHYKPETVVIGIGISSSGWMEPEYFAYKYSQFITAMQEASPETQIIVMALLPVDKRYDANQDSFSNKKINCINYYIGAMCEDMGLKFLDPTSVLKNEKGQAKAGYTYDDDGLHPSPEANEAIFMYVRTHMCPTK